MYKYTDIQPEWKFIDDLKSPLHKDMPLGWHYAEAPENSLSLDGGIRIVKDFPDAEGLLDTAYLDFAEFLYTAELDDASIPLYTRFAPMSTRESYEISVTADGITITSGDTEGIRRGIYYIEDEIKRCGRFLPLGTTSRSPFVLTRLSRCFWGPIKRPPMMRDELDDDEDYYPDNYLSRLAHDGVNGVWLTVSFKELLPSTVIPEYDGHGNEKKLRKLNATIEKCRRYGIGVYAFCIEPEGISDEIAAAHPELAGLKYGNVHTFCTGSDTGLKYLEEAFYTLFKLAPGLKGVINITTGEKWTHCYSPRITDKWYKPCPVCSKYTPVESVRRNLEAMVRGIRAASPDAEFISWPYSQYNLWGHDMTVESAAATPEGVCFCSNFESGGVGMQLGGGRNVNDYWLSYAGPAELFERIANAVKSTGQRMFAKLQVGCSHEVATLPFIPVPGKLYEKYSAMKRLNVSGAMQCWYFGNYPSIMTHAAGELSFETFEDGEDAFLLKLAKSVYGRHAKTMVKAWKIFAEAYSNYPLNNFFGYYGPMHDGPVWPLYPEPKNLPIAPSWELGFDPTGDRVGEGYLASHTPDEVVYLCERMSNQYNNGIALLDSIEDDYRDMPDIMRDFRVCRALGIQLESGYNIMKFYLLREQLPTTPQNQRLGKLRIMRDITEREVQNSRKLAALSAVEPSLGFHSEAEGYRYYPEKLEWRAQLLENLLETTFPMLERRIADKLDIFPEYSGRDESFKNVAAHHIAEPYSDASWASVEVHSDFTCHADGAENRETSWQAAYDAENLYIRVTGAKDDVLYLEFEPRALRPFPLYIVTPSKSYFSLSYDINETLVEGVDIETTQTAESTIITVGLSGIERGECRLPLRFNIVRPKYGARWVDKPDMKPRMVYNFKNTTEYGYIRFE